MIPKKLHYCWFGDKPKPESFQKCLESWEHFCPDFEIIEWNESNAPNINYPFYKNALRKKQYAFVSDSVRSFVLYEYGGVYLDTDMLLLDSIESLVLYNFFIGEEVKGRINFALFGTEPKNRFLKEMKTFYSTEIFNEFSPPVITHTFKHLVRRENLVQDEIIFPPEVFYPLPYEKKDDAHALYITDTTLAVHLWDHSWKSGHIETKRTLIKNLMTVFNDYFFYGYPFSYFRRYTKEFGRKLYHKLLK